MDNVRLFFFFLKMLIKLISIHFLMTFVIRKDEKRMNLIILKKIFR